MDTDTFLGQVEAFAFNYAPSGWLACQGQLLPINNNTALFSVLGTTYGGDGIKDFALPKLAPLSQYGPNYFICVDGRYPSRN